MNGGGSPIVFKVRTTSLDGTGVMVVSVEGDLDIANAQPLTRVTQVAVEAGCALLLDLSECSFIDLPGLRSVLRAHLALREIGEPMAVVTGRSAVRSRLSATGIDLSVRVFTTPEEALACLATERVRVRDRAPVSLDASVNGGPSTASPASP